MIALLLHVMLMHSISIFAAPSVVVEIVSGNACGDAAAIESRATARGVTVSRSADSGSATARVRVLNKDGAMEGTLVLSRADGTTTTRVVAASTCDEVLDALAFTLSLALEGEATEPPPTTPPPTPTPPPPPVAVIAAPQPDRIREPPKLSPVSPPMHFTLVVGAGGGVLTGTSPTVAGAIAAWAMIGGERAASLFAPAAIVGARVAFPTVTQSSGATVTSTLQAATIDLCPLRLSNESWAFRPCARTLLGRGQVRSEGFAGARLENSFLATVGVIAWIEAKITGPLFVSLDFGVGIPVERSTYFVGNSRAFETPAITIASSLGLGVHFL